MSPGVQVISIQRRDKPEIDAFEMGRPRSMPRASKPPEIGVILG